MMKGVRSARCVNRQCLCGISINSPRSSARGLPLTGERRQARLLRRKECLCEVSTAGQPSPPRKNPVHYLKERREKSSLSKRANTSLPRLEGLEKPRLRARYGGVLADLCSVVDDLSDNETGNIERLTSLYQFYHPEDMGGQWSAVSRDRRSFKKLFEQCKRIRDILQGSRLKMEQILGHHEPVLGVAKQLANPINNTLHKNGK